MSTETQKVDVLAVMDRQLEFAIASDYNGASQDYRDLSAARDAVAELIKAVKVYRKNETCQCEYCVRRRLRIDDALARVGGAA